MKNLVLAIITAASYAISAHANLGDTYKESCQRFNGHGEVNKLHKCIFWSSNGWTVTEYFQNNYCVCVLYYHDGQVIDDPMMWQMLSQNAPSPTWTWLEYDDELGQNHRSFSWGKDSQFVATFWNGEAGGQFLRVTTQKWLRQHNLWVDKSDNNNRSN